MDGHAMKPMVLARIPNLNTSRASRPPEGTPASSGRILSQAFSFKVLASVVLVLVAVALVPLAFKRDTPSPEPTTMAEAWNPGTSAVVTDTAAAWPAPVAEVPATPATMPSIVSEPNAANVAPVSASMDEPLMSTWPNPSQTTSSRAETGAEEPRADVNQSMAIRPSARAY